MTEDKKQKTPAAEQADTATQESGKQAEDKERSACGRARESAEPTDGKESAKSAEREENAEPTDGKESTKSANGEESAEPPEWEVNAKPADGEESAEPPEGDASAKPEDGHAAEAERAAPVRAVFGVSSDSGVDHRPAYGKDKYSFLWGLLSFFAPVVAFALRNLWRRTYPLRSKSILIGSVLGIVFYVALFATAVALIVVKINLYKP